MADIKETYAFNIMARKIASKVQLFQWGIRPIEEQQLNGNDIDDIQTWLCEYFEEKSNLGGETNTSLISILKPKLGKVEDLGNQLPSMKIIISSKGASEDKESKANITVKVRKYDFFIYDRRRDKRR